MQSINWLTVIVSVVVSTITAVIIAKMMLDRMLYELNKSDDKFLQQLEILKIETLDIIKKKKL